MKVEDYGSDPEVQYVVIPPGIYPQAKDNGDRINLHIIKNGDYILKEDLTVPEAQAIVDKLSSLITELVNKRGH